MAQLLRVRGIERTTPGFRAELIRMANRLGLRPDAIAGVMALESGFNPQAVNPNGGATGILQFMPNTAKALGTTTAELLTMNATEQLKFVELYFRRTPKLTPGSRIGDYYLAVFMPAFIGMPDVVPIAAKGSKVYDQNAVLDRDKDGVLTVGDVRAVLESEIARASGVPPLEVDPLAQATPQELADQALAASASSSPQASRPLCFGGQVPPGLEVSNLQLWERIAGLGAEQQAFRTMLERLEAIARRLETVAARFDARSDWESEVVRRVEKLEEATA